MGSEEEEDGSEVAALRAEIEQLREELEEHKGKTREMWRVNCEQIAEMDALLSEKEDENSRLKEELARLRRASPSPHLGTSEGSREEDSGGHLRGVPSRSPRVHRGKAPPVDAFTGVDPECRFEDWLPMLKRAANWNGWTEDDLLLQLAGHLKGRTLQEWNLLLDSQKTSYDCAVRALQARLDPGSRVMAAQDFRHAAQDKEEKVGDFIHRLE